MTTKRVCDDPDPERLFVEQLDTIERAIGSACRRAMMRDQDREDFASWVKLKLIENEYAVIRKHDRRASFAGYMVVVVHRLLLDYRIAHWGKWHASAEAKRLGDAAIAIEAMLYRDGRALEEVLPVLIRRWPELTRQKVEELAKRLPVRLPRPRTVEIEGAADAIGADPSSIHDAAFAADRRELSRRIDAVIRTTLSELESRERLLFRLRFEGSMTIAEIARTLGTEQKPLYRQLQRILTRLRTRLEAAGIAAADAEDLMSARGTDFDFGFGSETANMRPSRTDEEER